jgi:hypothetical protein
MAKIGRGTSHEDTKHTEKQNKNNTEKYDETTNKYFLKIL